MSAAAQDSSQNPGQNPGQNSRNSKSVNRANPASMTVDDYRWESTPYNDYALKKAQMARDRSSFIIQPETMDMELESLNFIRLYNLQTWLGADRRYQPDSDPQVEIQRIRELWHQASGEDKRTIIQCVKKVHEKYQIDVTHGLDAIKKQWIAENGGSNDSLERQVLLRMFSSVGCVMLTAMKINGVNQIDTCDDPGKFMTTERLLSISGGENREAAIKLEAIEQALLKSKTVEPSQAQTQTQQTTGARIFSADQANPAGAAKPNNSEPD